MKVKQRTAQGYRQQGYTYKRISQLMGISDAWAWILCNPEARERLDRQAKKWQASGVCQDCGGPMTRPGHGVSQRGKPHERCLSCHTRHVTETAFRKNVVGETLYCRVCHEHRSFSDYPAGVLAKYLNRRSGAAPRCRPCDTAARTAYRRRHLHPCVDCGTPCDPEALTCRPCSYKRLTKEAV